MNKEEITLDILRKEYEFIEKSIDECYKNRYSLYPIALGALTLTVSFIIGLYNKQSENNLIQIVNHNWKLLSMFLSFTILLLAYCIFKNRQEITVKTVYKVYLENEINHMVGKPILIWDSKVLKRMELTPYSLGIADILFLSLSAVLILSLYIYQAISNQISLETVTIIFLVFWGFVCWLFYIWKLPKKLKKALYSRGVG